MSKRILFIGAGASLGARTGHSRQPPLGQQLCDWLREQIPILQKEICLLDIHQKISRGSEILEKYSVTKNFEYLVSLLEPDDRIALQRLLQICFSDLTKKRRTGIDLGFRSAPDKYDDLIGKLDFRSCDWIVISLNYDLLFEEALKRKNITFKYSQFPFILGQDQSKEPDVWIYKPHGSINFFARSDHRIFYHEPTTEDDRGQSTEYDFDEDGNTNRVYPIFFAEMPGLENTSTRTDSSNIIFPVMANYTSGKKSDVNLRTLELVRQSALAISKKSGEIIVIGVKPIAEPADDNFVHKLLSMPVTKYTYITKDESDAEAIRSTHNNALIYPEGLDEFLAN